MSRSILVCFLFLALLLPLPQQARSGGIPTFDALGLSQKVLSYVTELQGYMKQIEELKTAGQQYTTMVQQYERELEEYQHFLRQAQSMGAVLDSADWNKVLEQTLTYYGESPWSAIPNINVTTAQGATNLKTVIETAYDVPTETAETVAAWQTRIPGYQMPAREQKEHSQNYALMQRYTDRQKQVATNQANITDRAPDVERYMEEAMNLPDDSELQTQQLIAQEMAYLLQQQEILTSQVNQLIASQETMSEFAASQDAKAKRLSKENQEKHKNNYLPSSLGSNQWKNL